MRRILAGVALALSTTVTACAVSTQQEVEMGQQYSEEINRQLPIVQDREINAYLRVLGDSIARLTARGDLEWRFFLVDSKEVNAFALPGGFIYVNRGIVERAQRMDQLAGVLGHEIGHVVRRHSVKQMQQMQTANVGVALGCVLTSVCASQAGQTAINLGGTLLFSKFSRGDEAQADEEGVANVVRAGIDPHGLPEMFRTLIEERQTEPDAVSSWFASHPLEEDRVADTERMIGQIDPAILKTLTKDSPAFQRFKARVHALPPSPTPRSGAR